MAKVTLNTPSDGGRLLVDGNVSELLPPKGPPAPHK